MHHFLYTSGLMLYISLFLFGKLAVERRWRLVLAPSSASVSNQYLCKFFQYAGKTFEAAGSTRAFLEVATIVVLTRLSLFDLVVRMTL